MLVDIDNIDCIGILQPEVFALILDAPTEVERVELEEDFTEKANELGVKTAFKRRLAAYKKDNAKINSFTYSIDLTLNDKGAPVVSIDNFLKILKHDDKYANKLYLNELTWAPEKETDGKRIKWTDEDDAETRRYIEKTYGIHNEKKLDDALRIVFNENKYNPVKEIIESVEWDGKPRIKDLLCKWMGVDDDEYSREVSRLIFAGGINRLYNPGCKFDDMPVLVGQQGGGKSTFVRWLAMEDEFFREVNEIEGQKGIEALEGAWICEMGELLALTRTKEVEAVKSYLSRQCDHYRKPFDKRTSDHARQCIFIGTTNKEEFLTDKTGNRRYYPVTCNNTGYELNKNEDEIKADILQCWAEAKYLYDKGEMQPCADINLIDTIRDRQAMAVEYDYRIGMIEAYLDKQNVVCAVELWQKALCEIGKPTRKDSNEITVIMQGFKNWNKGSNPVRIDPYGVQRCWYKNKDV